MPCTLIEYGIVHAKDTLQRYRVKVHHSKRGTGDTTGMKKVQNDIARKRYTVTKVESSTTPLAGTSRFKRKI